MADYIAQGYEDLNFVNRQEFDQLSNQQLFNKDSAPWSSLVFMQGIQKQLQSGPLKCVRTALSRNDQQTLSTAISKASYVLPKAQGYLIFNVANAQKYNNTQILPTYSCHFSDVLEFQTHSNKQRRK
jgi:hypothetical protein